MCTLLVLFRTHPAATLVIAANRDEFYARPTTGAGLLLEEPLRAVGGRDLKHGGTWMGLNAAGLFVGLTNMRSHDADRRSRGEIVMAALRCRTTTEVVDLLRREAGNGEFRPFNLLFGNADDLRVAYHRDHSLVIEPLATGRHVLPSGGVLDDPSLPKARRAHELLERAAAEPDLAGLIDALYAALADATVPDVTSLPEGLRGSDLGDELVARIQAINVKTELYGTRSSTIVVLGSDHRRYYYADGPPPATLRRVDHLL